MLSSTDRTKLKKAPRRAGTDITQLYQIIDESKLGHVAISDQNGPVVIPMLFWRDEHAIYLHGANNSRLMRALANGQPTCVTFTLLDGWVLARSAFHHSAHYRSAVVFGVCEQVEERAEKNRLLNHFIEQIAPGRTAEVRPSSDRELDGTTILKLSLDEASVKINNGGVNDDQSDLDREVWAGVIPFQTIAGPLIDDVNLSQEIKKPDYSQAYGERWNRN
ncbi:pyridoxamine 5'-phosphate oxidase family protein [Vibrio sp.]|nr:pyridoxamine 5'-phosphate oxidase family protein [Vibrio sp.]